MRRDGRKSDFWTPHPGKVLSAARVPPVPNPAPPVPVPVRTRTAEIQTHRHFR